MFGFTNDESKIEAVRAFRDAAVADGWSIEATYGKHEPLERAAKLHRDGFVMRILTRDNTDRGYRKKYEAEVNIWGPDGMAITPPKEYSFAAISDGVLTCGECKKTGVKTQLVGFANRACSDCAPALRAVIEKPGWCD